MIEMKTYVLSVVTDKPKRVNMSRIGGLIGSYNAHKVGWIGVAGACRFGLRILI